MPKLKVDTEINKFKNSYHTITNVVYRYTVKFAEAFLPKFNEVI